MWGVEVGKVLSGRELTNGEGRSRRTVISSDE